MANFNSLGFNIEYDDNSPEILDALKNAVDRGLRACGERAVNYAQKACPVKTGNLKGSITYAVEGEDCYIGTDVEYAIYVEMGTGRFAECGGRMTPWVYVDDYGIGHRTEGTPPRPFLRPSAQDHTDEYRSILKDSLTNA